jgi:glycosyltransferase involved in cell wall biosynthesis
MAQPSLLCVCNFPTNTGYAWNFIEGLYAEIARRIAVHGIRTFVAYPRFDGPPRTLEQSPAIPIELDASLKTRRSTSELAAFVRKENVTVVYFTDRPARSYRYAPLRLSGVRRIIVHDHSSGFRSGPTGMRRGVKWAMARLPLIVADDIITVSDYVAWRQVNVGLIPRRRVTRVWNGIPVPPLPSPDDRRLHAAVGAAPDRPIVGSASRAASEKGIPTLLRAFDLMMRRHSAASPRPLLVYMGDGPDFKEIQDTRAQLASRDDIVLTGYRPDAAALLACASVCVVPSVWQDALPLSTMQPMAVARPVVASAVGGIPEMIVDGETGLLVPPGDEQRLAGAIQRLLTDRPYAEALGRAARARIASLFTPAQQLDTLTAFVERGFGLATAVDPRGAPFPARSADTAR